MMKMRKFNDYLGEQMRNEAFRKEYEKNQPELDIIRAIVEARASQHLTREFDSKKQKKRLEALQTLHFFVKFSIFILRLFTSSVII